jgi:hypothetical protein
MFPFAAAPHTSEIPARVANSRHVKLMSRQQAPDKYQNFRREEEETVK